jgi:hypothetical protein
VEDLRNVGHQRQRDIARRLAETVKPDRRVQTRYLRLAHAVSAQPRCTRLQPRTRANGANIKGFAFQRGGQTALVIFTVVGKHCDGGPAVDPDGGKGARRIAAVIDDTGKGRRVRTARRD